jgi:hypothetical protein
LTTQKGARSAMRPPAPLLSSVRGKMSEAKTRAFLFTVRQALIILLGALEDYLSLERSIVPKHKRDG